MQQWVNLPAGLPENIATRPMCGRQQKHTIRTSEKVLHNFTVKHVTNIAC